MPKFIDAAEAIGRSGDLFEDDKSKFDLVFKAYDCLQSIYSKSSEIDLLNVESLFAAFEMAETIGSLRGLIEPHSVSELIPAITRMIVRTIEQSVRFPSNGRAAPVPYAPFCDWVRARIKDVSIVTFNYDLCIDWTFHLTGTKADYWLSDNPEGRGSVDVLKLHGSLNWSWCEQCALFRVVSRTLP